MNSSKPVLAGLIAVALSAQIAADSATAATAPIRFAGHDVELVLTK